MSYVYRDADLVSHFRHCGRLKSAATNQGDMYLTGNMSGNLWTGDISVKPLTADDDHPGFNQAFWLYSDYLAAGADPGTAVWDGDTYIASANYFTTEGSAPGSLYYHNLYSTMSSGARVYMRLTGNSFSPTAEAFNVVGNSDGTFIIYARDQTLCLTAGSSASDTLSSQNVSLYMVEYSGMKNQHWTLEDLDNLTGIYQLAPILNSSFAIASPGQSDSNSARLGIISYDNSDITATWITMFETGDMFSPTINSIPFYYSADGSARVWMDANYSDEIPKPIFQTRTSASTTWGGENIWYRGKLSSPSLTTLQGSYYGRRYLINLSALSTKAGDQQLDSLVWGDTESSSTLATNYPQYWLKLPQNLYDPTLPQPYDIQLWMWDYTDSVERQITSLDEIDPTHDIRLCPRFICDATAYVVTLRISADDDSSDWSVILSPTNGARWTGLGTAPFATPGVGEAWAPNAFAESVDDDGYVHLGTNFEFPYGLWTTGMPSGPLRLSVTVRAFAYGEQLNDIPWLPYQGRSSTSEFRIGKRYLPTLSAPSIDEKNLVLTWGGAEYTSIHSETDIIRIKQANVTWTDPGTSDVHTENILLDAYDCKVKNNNKISIPLTALNADVAISVIRALASSETVTLLASSEMYLVSKYGTVPLSLSDMTLGMKSGSTPRYASHTPYRYWTEYNAIGTNISLVRSYQRVNTERGPRLVEMYVKATDSARRIAVWADGTYFTLNESVRNALLFAKDLLFQDQLYYSVMIDSQAITNPVASLSWQTSDKVVHIMLLEGNLSFSYGRQRDVSSAIRRGARRYVAASSGTEMPSLKFSGTVYKDQLQNWSTTASEAYALHESIGDLYRIPDDTTVMLRTSYGTTYSVIITSIESPRSQSNLAQVTINMLEVES